MEIMNGHLPILPRKSREHLFALLVGSPVEGQKEGPGSGRTSVEPRRAFSRPGARDRAAQISKRGKAPAWCQSASEKPSCRSVRRKPSRIVRVRSADPGDLFQLYSLHPRQSDKSSSAAHRGWSCQAGLLRTIGIMVPSHRHQLWLFDAHRSEQAMERFQIKTQNLCHGLGVAERSPIEDFLRLL